MQSNENQSADGGGLCGSGPDGQAKSATPHQIADSPDVAPNPQQSLDG